MKRGILTIALAGITTYLATKQLGEQKAEPTFEWISAEGEENPEPLPMFHVGERIQLYNPYLGAIWMDTEEHPEEFEISDVKYDYDESVFRYKLDAFWEDGWVSEDWLSLPMHTSFLGEVADAADEEEHESKSGKLAVTITVHSGMTNEMTEAERKIMAKALDDDAKQTLIDYLLDVIREGSAEEREKAEKDLTALTSGD